MGLRLLNIFLASVIFISTIGVTVNRHYCQKQLRSTGLWWIPQSCHEMAALNDKLPSCPFHAIKSDAEKRKCCSEESDYVKTETTQDFIFDDVLLKLPFFVITTPSFLLETHIAAFVKADYDIYCFHPPPDKVPRTVLYQSFLI
jgi:hypothetical protein